MKPTKVFERSGLLFEEVTSDRLSSKIRKITGKISTSDNFEQLIQKGKSIVQNLTYLRENLRILEQDQAGQQIMLRSVEPDKVKQNIEYFELILKESGDLSLERYSYSKDKTERNSTDFVLSHELIERLSTDLNQL